MLAWIKLGGMAVALLVAGFGGWKARDVVSDRDAAIVRTEAAEQAARDHAEVVLGLQRQAEAAANAERKANAERVVAEQKARNDVDSIRAAARTTACVNTPAMRALLDGLRTTGDPSPANVPNPSLDGPRAMPTGAAGAGGGPRR